jgi:hypothetical protein
MTITTKTFQNLQPGVPKADDLRVRRPINEALNWLGEGLVDELNTHFAAISQSISAHIAGLAAFRAHKNAANQESISAGGNPITFGTEDFDIGGFFATNTWTPPAGKHRISTNIHFTALNAVDNELLTVTLVKNAAADTVVILPRAGTSVTSIVLTALVTASGTDTFTVNAAKAGAGVGRISGDATVTYFCGEQV